MSLLARRDGFRAGLPAPLCPERARYTTTDRSPDDDIAKGIRVLSSGRTEFEFLTEDSIPDTTAPEVQQFTALRSLPDERPPKGFRCSADLSSVSIDSSSNSHQPLSHGQD